ncbi:uncharacterized protein HD556DRAFT_798855 [Suillus plorans]|uniref:Secreted protein n=1 Tax=Suillus plorans TaxID=116603 RepID=A0A9P7DSI1_9AGAM|nr:uncharacterized protein HD556DRAFT_798855 [Suillus plorans]KAG1802102.1 hypothetical protein HD556DRAFT_798855 [Suillus plorans]
MQKFFSFSICIFFRLLTCQRLVHRWLFIDRRTKFYIEIHTMEPQKIVILSFRRAAQRDARGVQIGYDSLIVPDSRPLTAMWLVLPRCRTIQERKTRSW